MNKIFKNILLFICFLNLIWTQNWELVWSDEFEGNGEINSENWFHQTQLPLGEVGIMVKYNIIQTAQKTHM